MNRDRQARLMTAAMLLVVLKQNGLAARSAAEFLGLSPATMSCWAAMREGQERAVGVPTDEHLAKLVALLRYQVEQNLYAISSLIHSSDVREIEKILLLKAVLPSASKSIEHLGEDLDQWTSFADHIRKLVAEFGSDAITASLMTAPSETGEWPSSTQLDATGLPLGQMMMDSRDFLRRFDSAETENEHFKRVLAEHFKKKWAALTGKRGRRTAAKRGPQSRPRSSS